MGKEKEDSLDCTSTEEIETFSDDFAFDDI